MSMNIGKNGVVENPRRHIVEKGLALLSRSGVHKSHWSYAFYIAVFLLNRLPSRVFHGKSPYEILFSKVPNCPLG